MGKKMSLESELKRRKGGREDASRRETLLWTIETSFIAVYRSPIKRRGNAAMVPPAVAPRHLAAMPRDSSCKRKADLGITTTSVWKVERRTYLERTIHGEGERVVSLLEDFGDEIWVDVLKEG